ncbi:MAG TPA: TauD/TfdA family dioxygenase [Chromatiaceae bacterium]|nr:TauD/TfdA family dioxygenase [Chromatiaceae bacterium]
MPTAAAAIISRVVSATPFDLDQPEAYARWREHRLGEAPTRIEDLIVEVGDPRRLTQGEYAAILDRCRRANMAIYVGGTGDDPDKEIVRALGARFGLHRLDHNMGADEDAITSLKVQADALHREYIPYSDRPIAWHTDGYYNTPEHRIQGLLLHCVQPAATGGANALLDHEIAYILVRDQNPDFIRALMHPLAMTIPANLVDGKLVRPEQPGPVFSVTQAGSLHMRYTDRKRNIQWRDDPLTTAALACLREVLHGQTPWHMEGRLESGWGLLSNNVLHTRTGFSDGPKPRLLYRGRYYDRIEGT